jgi:hypothetical protein
VVNTSDQAVNGMILEFSDRGWTSTKDPSSTFHVVQLATGIAPTARAVIEFGLPIGSPWYVMNRGARGDIVEVFARWSDVS